MRSGLPPGQAGSPTTFARRARASPTTASPPSCRTSPPATSRHVSSSAHSSSGHSFDLLDELLDRPLDPAATEPGDEEHTLGVGRVESPRGATLCIVEHTAGRIERLRLRTGSYANWPVVAHAAAGNLLPDFPLINKSFELCYACADR